MRLCWGAPLSRTSPQAQSRPRLRRNPVSKLISTRGYQRTRRPGIIQRERRWSSHVRRVRSNGRRWNLRWKYRWRRRKLRLWHRRGRRHRSHPSNHGRSSHGKDRRWNEGRWIQRRRDVCGRGGGTCSLQYRSVSQAHPRNANGCTFPAAICASRSRSCAINLARSAVCPRTVSIQSGGGRGERKEKKNIQYQTKSLKSET